MIKPLVAFLIALSIQGCAFLDHSKNSPAIPPGAPVNISAEALTTCPLLKDSVLVSSFEEAIILYGDLAETYEVCANKQKASIKLIKELGNIE
jgi:hypothetical protein